MRFLLWIAVFLASLVAAEASNGPIVLEPRDQSVLVDDRAGWLKDNSGTLTVEGAHARRAQFNNPQKASLNFGLAATPYWLRFEVENPSPLPRPWVYEASDTVMDYVDVYVHGPEGGWEHKEAGDRLLPSAKELDPRKPSFLFLAPPQSRQEVFVRYRIEPVGAQNLTAHVYSPDMFERAGRTEMFFYGIFYGGLVIMFLYNLFIWISVRDISYLYYVAYQLVVGLFWLGMNGFGITYVWPQFQELGRHITVPLVGLSLVTANLFMQSFLRTRERHPAFHRVSHLIYALGAANILLWLFGLPKFAIPVAYFSTLAVLIFLFGGILAIRNGYKPARYYTIAWVTFIGGTCVFAFKDMGVLPYNAFTNWSAQGGGLLEMALLSFALADRIKTLNEEKAAAERQIQAALTRAKEELEQKVAERTGELQHQMERATQATALKDNYVTLVSHDLRSPLASLLSMMGFFKDEIGNPRITETMPPLLDKAYRSLESMLHMIDQLLDINRLQSGTHELRLRYLAARELADSKISLLSQTAVNKNITVVNAVPGDMHIIGDYHLVGEVIANIVSNAIKFTPSGGHVRVFAPEEARTPVIAVEDDGVGIAPELLPRLFSHEVKNRSWGTAGEKGNGLGLPYCMDIMRVHGGSISIERKPFDGSIFFINFPRPAHAVVVVDDQEVHRRIVRKMLSRFSHIAVIEAHDGGDALAQIKGRTPVLVITDMKMPKMTGLDLLAALRNTDGYQDLPVLMMTSYLSPEDGFDAESRAKAEELKIAGIIPKPIIEADFIAQVIRHLPQPPVAEPQ